LSKTRLQTGVFFKNKESNQVSESSILKVLAEVQDPDLHRDIVSLGFVKNLKVQSGKVSFDVELTTPACPVKEQLKNQCYEKVKALPGVTEVEVKMTANVRSTGTQSNRVTIPGVRNVIAVASGKGGVGKSTVTLNLAVALAETGARVGLLDADIYGPSIPLMIGAKEKPVTEAGRIEPVVKNGIKIMSMGFLVPENQPIVWRGPMIHGALTQFLTQVNWGELDYLLIDMPPGTGDAQLSISQSAPLSGALIVTTPQEVSLLDARKGLRMFQNVKVPILGVIENMAGFVCGHCEEVTPIFRVGGGDKIAQEMGVSLLGSIPLDPRIAEGGDKGTPIVSAHPAAEVSKIYKKLAGDVAAQLSVYQAQNAGQFKPLTLEWQ
jgi:ATP-binding protein involved in chromosome partitioning